MKKYFWKTAGLLSILTTGILSMSKKLLAIPFDEDHEIADTTKLTDTSIDKATIGFLRIMLGYLSLLAVIFVLYGGITWMTAAGNDEKVMKAKKILTASVIGLTIILLSWALITFVFNSVDEVSN